MFNLDVLQAEAKRDLTNAILEEMDNYLENSQLLELNKSINNHLNKVQVYHHNNVCTDYDDRNNVLINDFIKVKRLKGLSKNSLELYERELKMFHNYSNKLFLDYSPDDIREYLIFRQELNECNKTTLNNIRRILSSFYGFLSNEEYILKNPMKAVHHIKEPKRVKKPFTDYEIETMRNALITKNKYRDIAIFELLLSSGIRVSECISLNIEDIDFENRTFNVIGKGNKERKCYFSTRASMGLKDYLNNRTDDNPALFVTTTAPYNRLQISGTGTLLRELGRNCNVDNVHAHRFRRTFASKLLHRNMPIEQIQKLLGHGNINTTLLYVNIENDDVKLNYSKYMK
jgi:site-specific recombinase XerD